MFDIHLIEQAEAHATAAKLAAGPTKTLAMIRGMMWASATNSMEEQLALENKNQVIINHRHTIQDTIQDTIHDTCILLCSLCLLVLLLQILAGATADAVEGRTAFVEKRPAKFTGN